jgi:hypothetical protein
MPFQILFKIAFFGWTHFMDEVKKSVLRHSIERLL